jgi:hypothetical protein
MGRRCRHMNPRDLGALQSIDARYINGVANGVGVQTWTDRCGARDYSQATSGLRPIYAANSINGQPSVRFDTAGSHVMECTAYSMGTDYSAFCVAKVDANAGGAKYGFILGRRAGDGPHRNGQTFSLSNDASDRAYSYSEPVGFTPPNFVAFPAALETFSLIGMQPSGSGSTDCKIRQAGSNLSVSFTAGTAAPEHTLGAVGGFAVGDSYVISSDMNLAALSTWEAGILPAPIVKRIEHSLSFAYKLPCS